MKEPNTIDRQWGVPERVAELRELRLKALENRHRLGHPPRLPSRKVLTGIIDQIGAVLYPHRLGLPDLTNEAADYFVGHTLNNALNELHKQIRLELQFNAEQKGIAIDADDLASDITRHFAAALPAIRQILDTDLQAAFTGDPAAHSVDEVLVSYPGINAIIHHRLAHRLFRLGAPMVARVISEIAHSATGIDIHPGASIDESFFIDHGTGVVIGETAIIGKRVRVYQAVTLGAKRFEKDDDGVLVKGNLRHPIVEDNVVIYAGATILGRITIGHDSTIGGNVWLTHSVPPESLIMQAQVHNEVSTF